MHTGRQLSRRLSFAGVLCACLANACASPRYIGSIGRDRTYSNRGFGLAIRLGDHGLGERWETIDPAEAHRAPPELRPRRLKFPLDLDGDGYLDVLETTEHMDPMLRLVSRTSTTAIISIQVKILGGRAKNQPIDEVVLEDVQRFTTTGTTALTSLKERAIAPGFKALIAEFHARNNDGAPTAHRIAWIDQPGFVGEEGLARRQLVRVDLQAAALSTTLKEDHDRLLAAMILNRRGSTETVKEKW